jgi:putative transcriptional regulator
MSLRVGRRKLEIILEPAPRSIGFRLSADRGEPEWHLYDTRSSFGERELPLPICRHGMACEMPEAEARLERRSMKIKDSQAIVVLRRKLAMTQEEFADALGVTVGTVNRWENGHFRPSRLAEKALERLAEGVAADLVALDDVSSQFGSRESG